MKLRRAFSLAISNFPLIISNAIYRIVVILIALLSLKLIAGSTLTAFFNESTVNTCAEIFKEWAKPGSDVSYVKELGAAFDAVLNTINTNSAYSMCIFGFVLVFVIADFLLGICDFTVGAIINLHMSSMHHSRFVGAYIGNFNKAIISKLLQMAVALVYYFVVVPLLYFLVLLTSEFMGVLVIGEAIFLFVVARTLIVTKLEYMIPKIVVDNYSIWNAFISCVKEKDSARDFWYRAIVYFSFMVITLSINVMMCLTTFGVGLLITFPLCSLVFVSIHYVDYYYLMRRKYYVTFDNIVIPKELRDNDENLLNSVEID